MPPLPDARPVPSVSEESWGCPGAVNAAAPPRGGAVRNGMQSPGWDADTWERGGIFPMNTASRTTG